MSLCSSPFCSCSQTDVDVSRRNNKKFSFQADKHDQYSPLSRYEFSHNLPPHPQGFWLPRVCLHATCFWFTPSPLWMWASVQCLFFLRPRSQCLHVWVCFCLWMYISHLFFWIVKQEGRAGPCLIVTCLPLCLFSFQKFVSLELLGELAKHVLHPVPMLHSALLWGRKDAATPLELTDGACGLFCYL